MSYLSIDLDYWNYCKTSAIPKLDQMVDRAEGLGIPIVVVTNHQQLLREVDSSPTRELINIDTHSDLAGADVQHLSCGTWVSYVQWRLQGLYYWMRSTVSTTVGACTPHGSWRHDHDWGTVRTRYVNPDTIDLIRYLKGCVGIGICLSPSYTEVSLQRDFKRWASGRGMVIRRGRLDEHRLKRHVCPSF